MEESEFNKLISNIIEKLTGRDSENQINGQQPILQNARHGVLLEDQINEFFHIIDAVNIDEMSSDQKLILIQLIWRLPFLMMNYELKNNIKYSPDLIPFSIKFEKKIKKIIGESAWNKHKVQSSAYN